MTETELSRVEIIPDHILDAKGLFCPQPVLLTKKNIEKVPVNGVLEVQSTDEGSLKDIPRWAKRAGHEYLGHTSEADFLRCYVKRLK